MGTSAPTRHDQAGEGLERVTRVAVVVAACGLAALLAYGAWATRLGPVQAALGAGVLALGAVAAGALLGFLFGVPVNAVAVAQANSAGAQAAAAPGTAPKPSRGANQLVQISEWLTRIIIGATVTQLGEVRDQLQGLGWRASLQLLGTDRGEIAFTAAVVFGAIFGFFVGHLSTRLILNVLFDEADGDPGLPREAAAAVQASAADGKLTSISPTAARSVVAVDERKLTRSDDLQTWGLAWLSLDRDRPGVTRGVDALERAVAVSPNDRAALRSLALGALYAPPDGYTRVLPELESYFARNPTPTREDAQLLAYLACAHGQAFTAAGDDTARRERHSRGALAAVQQALTLDPSWRSFLESLARGTTPGEDDLVDVTAHNPELRALLLGAAAPDADKKPSP